MRKMYILIKDTIPSGLAITAASHGSLSFYLKYKESLDVKDWLATSFKKVICKVSLEEFEKVKEIEIDKSIITESSFENEETAIVFMPLEEMPKQFKYYKLWK